MHMYVHDAVGQSSAAGLFCSSSQSFADLLYMGLTPAGLTHGADDSRLDT
jgi:hypothetical protein